tara:strand:+ start:93 stop:2249 length:2157 start_codon:yes stop_codon:yes gene_type:complete
MAVNNIQIGTFSNGKIFNGIVNIYSSSLFPTTTNIRFAPLTNTTGLSPGWPSELSIPIRESSWRGLEYNQNDVGYENGNRFMQNRGTSNFAPGNTWICAVAGTYRILSWSNSNTISKNGTNVGSPISQNQTITTVCAIGDHIQGSKPFSFFYNTTIPGLQGAYGGYAGYVFGTRNDRNNGTKLLAFPLDSDPTGNGTVTAQIHQGIQSSANTNPIVSGLSTTSLTLTGTDYSVNNLSTNMSTTNNYYLASDVLMCCWRGEALQASIKDSVSMFPMTTEAKYGWFSTGGHILAMAGPDQKRMGETYQTTQIKQSYNSATVIEFTTGNMAGADVDDVGEWAYTDATPTTPGGTNYDGSPSVVYTDPGSLTSLGTNSYYAQAGVLFTCEQQADGDGSEMSNFVTEKCMSTFTCNHGGGTYMAFLSTYYDSTDAATIIHFTAARAYRATYTLGTTTVTNIGYQRSSTPYQWTSAYIDGEYGFNPIAGDVFKIATPRNAGEDAIFAAWGDITATTEDETIFVMGDTMDFSGGGPASFALIGNEIASAYGSSTAAGACSPDEAISFIVYKYFDTTIPDPQYGDGFYTDSTGDIAWTEEQSASNGGLFYKHQAGRASFAIEMTGSPASGQVESIVSCSDRRIKKNIKKIDVSPSGINIYKFEFKDTKWGKGEFVGVMAQEVPQAAEDSEGILFVNYNLLDVSFQEWNGDDCTCNQDICYNCHPSN